MSYPVDDIEFLRELAERAKPEQLAVRIRATAKRYASLRQSNDALKGRIPFICRFAGSGELLRFVLHDEYVLVGYLLRCYGDGFLVECVNGGERDVCFIPKLAVLFVSGDSLSDVRDS